MKKREIMYILLTACIIYNGFLVNNEYKEDYQTIAKHNTKQTQEVKKPEKSKEQIEKERIEKQKEEERAAKELKEKQEKERIEKEKQDILTEFKYSKMNEDYKLFAIKECKKYEIDPYVMLALFRQESEYNPNDVSETGCTGMGQLSFQTAKEVCQRLDIPLSCNDELFDPYLNMRISIKYFSELLRRYDWDYDTALYHYNGGSDPNYIHNVKRYIGIE